MEFELDVSGSVSLLWGDTTHTHTHTPYHTHTTAPHHYDEDKGTTGYAVNTGARAFRTKTAAKWSTVAIAAHNRADFLRIWFWSLHVPTTLSYTPVFSSLIPCGIRSPNLRSWGLEESFINPVKLPNTLSGIWGWTLYFFHLWESPWCLKGWKTPNDPLVLLIWYLFVRASAFTKSSRDLAKR